MSGGYADHALEQHCELEVAVMEANNMAEIVCSWMASTLEFENAGSVTLSSDQRSQVYWAMNYLTYLVNTVDRIFHGTDEAKP